jgi:HAE1 family hydrophobic/amphiphilic exporter-1
MWITKISISHPVFATMVMAALVVLGVFSYQTLGLERMPDVALPQAWIEVQYPGASPSAVETDVTRPIEEAINTVSGIKSIRSTSGEGYAGISVEFELSANVERGLSELRDKIAQVRPQFPREAKEPFIARQEGENAQPIIQLVVSSTTLGLRDLSTLSEQVIVKRLQAVPGVGQIITNGATTRQILIRLKPEAMTAQGVGVDELLKAIQDTNQNVAAGNVTTALRDQLVRVEGRMTDARAFRQVIVARRANGPVYLQQVADVVDGEKEAESISRINGERAISLDIAKVQDANIVSVGTAVLAATDKLRSNLPAGVTLRVLNDDSVRVQRQLENVKETIAEGAVLTIIIVFVFLHSWRSTIITGLTLPISVLASFIALHAFGFTLNFVTLMALSLSIGLLIDDAIVVRENIVRHLGMGKSHRQAASDGTNEIGLAVMATTFAIVAVFVPVAFMEGAIGRFFLEFGITVIVAVLVSLFVSFTLDPMLSSVWHDPVKGRFKYFPWMGAMLAATERYLDRLHGVYAHILRLALAWRKLTLATALLLFTSSLLLLPKIGTEMFPQTDDGLINLSLKTAVGSSLAFTDIKMHQVEQALRAYPDIDTVIATVGTFQGHHTARLDINLTDRRRTHRRSQDELEGLIRTRLARIAGISLTVGPKPIAIAILGTDEDELNKLAHRLIAQMKTIRGLTDIEFSLEGASPSMTVRIKNALASDLGLTTAQIGTALHPFIGGDTVTHWLAPDGQNYDVNVQLAQSSRRGASDLGTLSLASNKLDTYGNPLMVPLRQVVQFIPSFGPQMLKRQALQRQVSITAGVTDRPDGDVDADVKRAMHALALPPGVRFDVGGNAQQSAETTNGALAALGIGFVFIYLVLASQFGSFLQPIAIMLALPLSLIGVLAALFVTGSTLNVYSAIGVLMLMGLVTKNAILLVDFTNLGQRQGKPQFQAILDAGQVRLRPILMTTLAMIFGMLPMAIGLGDGGELQAPMGRAVIGGVLTSTVLTMVVVPVAYTYFDDWGRRAKRWFAGHTLLST